VSIFSVFFVVGFVTFPVPMNESVESSFFGFSGLGPINE
jgi:hypothetical protein